MKQNQAEMEEMAKSWEQKLAEQRQKEDEEEAKKREVEEAKASGIGACAAPGRYPTLELELRTGVTSALQRSMIVATGTRLGTGGSTAV